MASDKEPAKLLLPYLQRADELQKHEPLVAYYCRLYAMERGIKIPQSDRTKTTNALLVSLMNQLEKDKKSLQLGPDDHLHVEGFALSVFAKADKQDRAGRADLNTAKTFYAASIFFEILNQFGQLQPDLEQKQKYAVWKAADIRKALKEGRKPLPGPPDAENDLLEPSSASSGENDVEPNSTDFVTQPNLTSLHQSGTNAPESDPSARLYSQDDFQHPNFSSDPSSVTQSSGTPPSHYPTDNYPTDGIHQQHSANGSTHSVYDQPYYPQTYQQEPHQNLPQHYPSPHEIPAYSLPNFQTYPSFAESSLPTAPSHYPSFRQASDASYTNLSPSSPATYSPTSPYNSGSKNENVSEASSPPNAQKYEYDSSYQPPPDKIAEAHKAARFAVGALAFDDVFIAVDYLKKSLELLTNPSAN